MMGIKNFRMGLFYALWLGLSLGLVLVPAPLLAGNTTGTTRTQTYQPGEPFTGLPGGAPGRGYGTAPYGTPYGVGPYGAPSVYCQNWPGHSPYPQYPGTGPNTPCGPAFQPPAPQPQPQPPRTMSCSLGVGSADRPDEPAAGLITVALARADQLPELLLAQSSTSSTAAGLYIQGKNGGNKIIGATQADPALPSWLERSPLRVEIFKAMSCNLHRRFEFKSTEDLKNNITVRENIVRVMTEINSGGIHVTWVGNGFLLPSDSWEKWYEDPNGTLKLIGGAHDGQSLTWQSTSRVTASQAMDSFLNSQSPSRLECLTGVEMAVLAGVKRAFPTRFNGLHPATGGQPAIHGVGVPIDKPASFNMHLIPLRQLDYGVADQMPNRFDKYDMVPGDYAYLENRYRDNYSGEGDNGENAVFMSYFQGTFYGLGLGSGATGTKRRLG